MNIVVNGAPRETDDETTVDALVRSMGGGERGVAVALNGEVVPRSAWSTTQIEEADRVEVLRAVGGG